MNVSLILYLGSNDVPFRLKSCSEKCQQDLVFQHRERNIALLHYMSLKKCATPFEIDYLSISHNTRNVHSQFFFFLS